MKRSIIPFALSVLLFVQCSTEPPPPGDIQVPEGFQVELLYQPSEREQGSWVCLTEDDKGRLIASDQYGALYRVDLTATPLRVDSLAINMGRAQGLLWAHNSLFISVNAFENDQGLSSGVYRLMDTTGDDQFDQVDTLASLDGAGEHGPHALKLGPDGMIYLIAGNHTDIPHDFSKYLPTFWSEDRLFPAVKDPRGHANDRGAPGGWIARIDPDGSEWEVIANGFRNAYDMDFDQNGALFTYDSDMEWDLGTPWYRPTRICHVIPGAEFGWRTGSAKWPEYYADNLPPVVHMGQGSPTGVAFGYKSHFPKEYQEALFVMDWSFGTIYKVDLKANGATFEGSTSEFLSGNSLPLTDLVFANDGALYFTTGGRRSASGLYRISYKDPQPKLKSTASPSELQVLRRTISDSSDPQLLIKHLGHSDRIIRYAARVGLERLPVSMWEDQILTSTDPNQVLMGTLALTRVHTSLALDKMPEELWQHQSSEADHEESMKIQLSQEIQLQTKGLKKKILDKLAALEVSQFNHAQKIDLVRTYGVLFSRLGPPEAGELNLPEFPSGHPALDRELSDLLAYLDHPDLVAAAIPLLEQNQKALEAELTSKEALTRSEQYGPTIAAMHENRPNEQSMALALALSRVQSGWSPEFRSRFFTWFHQALDRSGGASYKGFLERIRTQALTAMPLADRELLAESLGEALLKPPPKNTAVANPPQGPGRNWEVGEANELVSAGLENRSFARGSELYQALLCQNCHQMQGEGGNVGPDLTNLSTRASSWDILQSLQTPSLAISDQYSGTLYTLADGSSLLGRTLRSTEDSIWINLNPYQPESARVLAKAEISDEKPSAVSLMPGGLINQLNAEELLDFMAYLKSGGDPEHEMYQ